MNKYLNSKINHAMAHVAPEHTKKIGGERCVSLVALGAAYSFLWGVNLNSNVAVETSGKFRRIAQYIASDASPFFLVRDGGQDWVSTKPIPGVPARTGSVRPVTPSEFVLSRKVKGVFERNGSLSKELSLVDLSMQYLDLYGVSISSDVVYHTQGEFPRVIDWLEASDVFSVRRDVSGMDWVVVDGITPKVPSRSLDFLGRSHFENSSSGCESDTGVVSVNRSVGYKRNDFVPSETILTQRIKTILKDRVGLGGELSLVELAGEYHKLHGVPLRDGVRYHTQGKFTRFIDWVADSGVFNVRRGASNTENLVSINDMKGKVAFGGSSQNEALSTQCFKPRPCPELLPQPAGKGDVLRGQKVFIDTSVLLTSSFWDHASILNSAQGVHIIAPVIHELKEHVDRGGKLSVAAQSALDSIDIARESGFWRVVSSEFASGPRNYADPHFLQLAENAKEAICILTADNGLIDRILDARAEGVSVFFFDRKRGILKPQYKIKTDDSL